MSLVLLIRHGETASNASRIVQTPETLLNERGRAQAALLAERLGEEELLPARILSSDLTRARMTAEPLAAAAAAPIELEPLLQERNFGELRGRAYAEIGLDIMADGYEPPGGESWEEFYERIERTWQRLAEALAGPPGIVAVVTHGLVCHALAEKFLELPAGEGAPLRWGNTSLTLFERERPYRVTLLNCTRHLEGTSAEDGAAPSGL